MWEFYAAPLPLPLSPARLNVVRAGTQKIKLTVVADNPSQPHSTYLNSPHSWKPCVVALLIVWQRHQQDGRPWVVDVNGLAD